MIRLDDNVAACFRVPQVAEYLGVSGATIRKWAHEGRIKYAKRCPGGDFRFSRKQIEEFANGGTKPEPVEA